LFGRRLFKQSHAGSSKQALAILQGLKADVVTYNQVTDVQIHCPSPTAAQKAG
jgi:ABC-type sulfate transport system substrate-binding protein